MSFRSILASLRSAPKPPRPRASGCRAGFRPRLEPLEDRTVLSTFTVLNLADNGDGSLRQAVLDANALPGADDIRFADGLQGTIALTGGQLSITDHLTIDGPGAGLLAVSGNHQSRVFNISGGAAVGIDDLTITNGQVVGDGGGILNTGGTLTLDRVVLTDNHAVATTSNTFGRGGAVANISGATLTVTDCQFTGNQARGGGPGPAGQSLTVRCGAGIYNQGSVLTVVRSAFTGNLSIGGPAGVRAQGGAINSIMGSTATITDCTFVGNQGLAGDGNGGSGLVGLGRAGALFNDASVMTVENCLIEGNVARGGSNITAGGRTALVAGGGGIFNSSEGVLVLRGCTIRGNLALGGSNNTGTGVDGDIGTAIGGGLGNVGSVTITDCLFEDNEARGGSGNRGSGGSFRFVGTGSGGAIFTSARNGSGSLASLTLDDVTVRNNRAIGGDGNAQGGYVGVGFGGGLGNDGSNPSIAPGGSTITLLDCTVTNNRAVGGIGAAAQGGGVANVHGGVVHIAGGTVSHNHATGGVGGDGFGGGVYTGPASTHPSNPGAPTVLRVEGSTITHNKAQGGAGAAGSSAGNGLGGGLWNGGTASIFDTAVSHNHALGGDGGNGFGGGVYNGATASLRLERCTVTRNHANGGDGEAGGNGGEGIGGGVYNLGDFDFDVLTLIFKNHASTSHDDVFDPFV
jgi:hypothetical protein